MFLTAGCASGGAPGAVDTPDLSATCRLQTTERERGRLYRYSTPPLLLNADRILLSMVPEADGDDSTEVPGGSLALAVLVDARGRVVVSEVRIASGDAEVDERFQRAFCAARFQPATRLAGSRMDDARGVPAWVEVRVEWDEDGAVHLRQREDSRGPER